ncbi:MAG: transposase [Planctomycetes bacterium]|nr:transposase [Planctomycetota bacterium]
MHSGITRHPGHVFMSQVARTLTDAFDGFLAKHRFLICDRDTKFTAQFRRILDDAGVRVIRTPKLAPNCNAFAERFVCSIKSECLNRMMLFGDAGLRRAVTEYLAHYNIERPHQGIGNAVIEAPGEIGTGAVERTERLGGILKSYRRAA